MVYGWGLHVQRSFAIYRVLKPLLVYFPQTPITATIRVGLAVKDIFQWTLTSLLDAHRTYGAIVSPGTFG